MSGPWKHRVGTRVTMVTSERKIPNYPEHIEDKQGQGQDPAVV